MRRLHRLFPRPPHARPTPATAGSLPTVKAKHEGETVSRATRDYNRRRGAKRLAALRLMLSRCDDRGFLQLAWATNMLQSDLGSNVERYLTYPEAAATSDMGAEFAIHKWDIETILAVLLSTEKYVWRPHEQRFDYRYDAFDNMATATNFLRDAENYEAGAYLERTNLMVEMHRIAHRQFGWQRGFATSERLYRFVYIYGQGACAAYFQQVHGLSIEDFLKVGFVLFTQLHHQPWAKPVSVPEIGVDEELIGRALPLLSLDLADVRTETAALIGRMAEKGEQRLAYLPSALRQYPVIRDAKTDSYIAPLPQLIMSRMTSGLYYDLAGGPQHVLTEANNRFEQYARKVIAAFYPRFQVLSSQRYGPKKAGIDSPDVLVMDGDRVVAVVECKATKLTFEAQFADDPMATAKRAYDQLVKGVSQMWRFFSHARRGIYAGKPVSPTAHGVLLTMDAWMQMAGELRTAAQQAARDLLKDDPDVTDEDMRPIVFCSMQDLADVMIISTADQFLATLEKAVTNEYFGWGLREVRRNAGGEEVAQEFPLDPAELLPWWGQFRR